MVGSFQLWNMFHFKNKRACYLPDRSGEDEKSRIEWFLFVHHLLNRFESGKVSKREYQILSCWVPPLEEELPMLHAERSERDAEVKIYRKIAEHFSSVHAPDPMPIPDQHEEDTGVGLLGNFPFILLFIIVLGLAMYLLFN